MSERIWGALRKHALYKSTYTLLYLSRCALFPSSPLLSHFVVIAAVSVRPLCLPTVQFDSWRGVPMSLDTSWFRMDSYRHMHRVWTTHTALSVSIVIRLEARLPPNIGFTLRDSLAVFTRSAVNPPWTSERIWMKSGALWVHCQGLALADFGHDQCSSSSLRGGQNFVFLSGK